MGVRWCVPTPMCMWEYQILRCVHWGYNSWYHLTEAGQFFFSAQKELANTHTQIGLQVLLLCKCKFGFYAKLIKLMSVKELCARILNSSCFLIFTSPLVLIILFLRFPFQFTKKSKNVIRERLNSEKAASISTPWLNVSAIPLVRDWKTGFS